MSEFWINWLTQQAPLFASLFAAIVGLILTALKYKKQKYEIAILKEQNEAAGAASAQLSPEDIKTLKSVAAKIRENEK